MVAGGLGGIGTAIVSDLAARGRQVVAVDRRSEAAADWSAQFDPERRGRIEFRSVDVSSEESVQALSEDLAAEGVLVDTVVNAQAVMIGGAVHEVAVHHFSLVQQVNVMGSFFMCRAFAPSMIRGGFGRIVNFTSFWAYQPARGQIAYATAKAAIVGMTRALAVDLAADNITVNAVSPGLVWHERLSGVSPDEVIADHVTRIPVGRAGTVDEAAALVRFLVSEDASFVNGQVIHLNGGEYMTA